MSFFIPVQEALSLLANPTGFPPFSCPSFLSLILIIKKLKTGGNKHQL
jgi:hypothetical protein